MEIEEKNSYAYRKLANIGLCFHALFCTVQYKYAIASRLLLRTPEEPKSKEEPKTFATVSPKTPSIFFFFFFGRKKLQTIYSRKNFCRGLQSLLNQSINNSNY